MELSLESLISDPYPVKSRLKQYIHRVEKEGNIEYGIEHSHYLTAYSVWYEITESYGRSRDDGEVESVEIVLSDRMTLLEVVYCKSTNNPRNDKNNTYDDELAMMEMESHMMNNIYHMSI
jgi:hypothetical protein